MADRLRPEFGRIVVTAVFALSASATAWQMVAVLRSVGEAGRPAPRTVVELASSTLALAFSVLVVTAYLRRGPAAATDRSPVVWLAAPLATCLPFALAALSALPSRPGGTGRSLLAFVLILTGTAWSVWSVRHLSTCLSVVPQARRLVDSGPYRLVRHPLYLGEVVAAAGFAVRGGPWPYGLAVVALLILQLYRAGREEALLAATVPAYPAYVARTWRIVPGVV